MTTKPEGDDKEPQGQPAELDEFIKAEETLDLLAKLAAASLHRKDYVIASYPAAHTQGFEIKGS